MKTFFRPTAPRDMAKERYFLITIVPPDARLFLNKAREKAQELQRVCGKGWNGLRAARLLETATRSLLVLCAIVFAMMMESSWCYPADVVFIGSARDLSTEQQEIKEATTFYGLDLKVFTGGASHNDELELDRAVELKETLAVVIAAKALAQVNERTLLRSLARRPGGPVPLLILGVTTETDPALLNTWSGGTAVGSRRLGPRHHLQYAIGLDADLAGPLKGQEIPFPSDDTFYFALSEHREASEIAEVRDDHEAVPVFIETTLNRQKVFLDCTMPRARQSLGEANKEGVVSAFAQDAPALMFVKYCAGARGWHALHHYANLTIDDAMLTEPYGFLEYQRLLAEMETHNFHTTIAFIPWNYDRCEAKVVSLVRSHPNRFSICVHGDNHDHKEFTDYRDKPLTVQVEALRQALARMNRFQTLTRIPYDKVMVFPHSIAPEKTLEALKGYDYLATVNSNNVPMGSSVPQGPLFALRPVTLLFGGFPSFSRYSAAAPVHNDFIAVNEFFDSPLLFYAHHELFERGIGAFDDVADRVNKSESDTRWQSLGDIVRHYYLLRLRDDSNYEVLAFSTEISLENTSSRASEFFVRKAGVDHPSIGSVEVSGQACPFHVRGDYVDFSVLIPAGQTRSVTIQYENHLSNPPIDIAKQATRVYILRMASQFRDDSLYRSATGRAVIHFYYEDGEPRPKRVLGSSVFLILFCVSIVLVIRISIRRRRRTARKDGSLQGVLARG